MPGKGMHALVSEKTPTHHVLCTNLCDWVGVNTILDLPSRFAFHRRPHRDPPNPGLGGTKGDRLADDPLAREVVLVRGGYRSSACCPRAHRGAQRRPRGKRPLASPVQLREHHPAGVWDKTDQPWRWTARRGAGLARVRPSWAAELPLAAGVHPDTRGARNCLACAPPLP